MAEELVEQKSKSKSDDAILSESKKRFKLCEDAERDVRKEALEDLRFRAGDQWPTNVKQAREAQSKPCLTINILPARERQILNDQRQNRPAIKVSPVDDKGDPETAEVLQGIIRHIEYDSNADVAYDTAFASAVRGGFGFLRVITEYESPDSERQIVKIKRIRNPFQVYMDPGAQEPDYSDARFGFVFDTLTKEEFKDDYPDSDLASLDDWNSVGDKDPDWLSEDGVRIVEYFYVEERKRPQLPIVHWCKHSKVEILERTDWVGRWIPIVPVLGDEMDVDGKRILEGIVRHTKDPVRIQNYMASAEVEAIALAPKAPYIAAAGQTEDFPEWGTLNTVNHVLLRYKPISVDGTALGPPQRNVAEPAIAAITQARLHFSDDLKAITGIYDAQLGARSNEQSGRAILQRKQQGEISNFHYVDNLSRALRFLGQQLIDLIPKIYTGPQVMRIIGEDGTQKVVKVNQPFDQGGVQKIFDLTAGRYDVTVSTGPSYQTKRQEAVASMIDMTKAYPQLAQIAGDLLVNSMDWPGHEKFAERIRKTLPPGLADDDGSDPKAQVAQLQGQMMQMKQAHDAINAYAQQKEGEVQQLQMEKQAKVVEMTARKEMADEENRVKILLAEINAKAQETQMRLNMERETWLELHGSAHTVAIEAGKQQHEKELAAQQADQAQQQQASDQEFQAQQAQQQQEQQAAQPEQV